MANKKANKKMTFAEILDARPDAAEIMMKYGLHCIGCAAAHFETVEEGCKAHGISDKNIDKMIEEINKLM
ncbi:DUF1858 domain-containing protein [Candidatus Woesearchaeota archaeon]|nr:DUF1858 domain-containing protein [Candidatus Woesearchaeota archaeon]